MTGKPPTVPPQLPPDADAWLEETKTVRKLGQPAPERTALPKMPPDGNGQPVKPLRHLATWNENQPIPVLSNTAECISGQAENLERGLLKDLAARKIPPTAVLDLHGLGEGDAWLHLVDFLHAAADADHRCALVIHGKGRGYGPLGDMGVIKYQIGGWLAGHPRVLAFHTAQPHDGGSGAVYVYLRRRRQI